MDQLVEQLLEKALARDRLPPSFHFSLSHIALDARLSLTPNNLSTYSFLLLIILGFMGRIRFRQPPEESHVQAGER